MKAVMVRDLTESELAALKEGVRSSDAFTLRRCQILLASQQQKTPQQIGAQLQCSDQCVREAIHAFHAQGLACLKAQSHAPKTSRAKLDATAREKLQQLLPQSPRQFGQDSDLWTLPMLAQVSLAQSITTELVSRETIRRALKNLGESWRRAKKWITSPDPGYRGKKAEPGSPGAVGAGAFRLAAGVGG